MEEITLESAVITDEATSLWGFAPVEDSAQILGTVSYVGYESTITDSAVITSEAEGEAYQSVSEAAKIVSSITWSATYQRDSFETARITSSATGQVVVAAPELTESAVVTSDSTFSDPFNLSEEAARIRSAVTASRTTKTVTHETAVITEGAEIPVFSIETETAVIVSDSTTSILNGVISTESAVIVSDITSALETSSVITDSAMVTSSVVAYRLTTDVIGDIGYISSSIYDPAYVAALSGWTANVVNWAMSEYRDIEVEEIHGNWGLGKNGVYKKGTDGVDCEFVTGQLVPAGMYAARCTHVVLGCSPETECQVSLRAESPDGGYTDYPASTWPVGTKRFVREFDTPRGVKSPSFGVKIQATAPNKLAVRSLSMTPLPGGRR
jgi:hypothetical protein